MTGRHRGPCQLGSGWRRRSVEQGREPLFEASTGRGFIHTGALPEPRSNERITEGGNGRQMYDCSSVSLIDLDARGGFAEACMERRYDFL
jgi:hypothetical protein